MDISKKGLCFSIFIFSIATLMAGCSGGGGGGDGGSPVPTTTISGLATDDPISGGNVTITDFATGSVIGTTTTNADGTYSVNVPTASLTDGYDVSVTGGLVNGAAFDGELLARYSASENVSNANVTLLTTLIQRLADREITGTPLEKRDASIQLLTSIGAIAEGDWQLVEPTNVQLSEIRRDIMIVDFESVMTSTVDDLQDGEVDAEHMKYFPSAHGGIVGVAIGENGGNTISDYPGQSGGFPVIVVSTDSTTSFRYELTEGPDWVTVDQTSGETTYAVPVDAAPNLSYPIRVQVTNKTTGFGRTESGSLFVSEVEVIADATVGTDGGVVTDTSGTIEIDVPSGAFTEPTRISITRGRDANGNVFLDINPQGTIIQPLTVHLPDPGVLDASTPTTAAIQSNLISTLSTPAEDGGDKCIGGGSNTPEMTVCWTALKSYYNVYKRMPNGFTYNISARHLFLHLVGSELWSSVGFGSNDLDSREPVLFVNGYNNSFASLIFKRTLLGGGSGTWGNFQKLILNMNNDGMGYLPFEFRWKTDARFQDVADDLASAIQLISIKTGKKVHIVAHSFGGVLTRVLLEDLSTFGDTETKDLVATVTTLGTPHSGIADLGLLDLWKTQMHGFWFPMGQDSDLFNFCKQISCFQMGENVLSLDFADKNLHDLQSERGYVAAKVYENIGLLPAGLPINVLIGMTGFITEENTYLLESGDALITYSGQRFSPDMTTTLGVVDDLLKGDQDSALEPVITEDILGFEDDVSPRTIIDITKINVTDPEIKSLSDLAKSNWLYTRGYPHSSPEALGTERGGVPEVAVECSEDTESKPCYHDAWLKTKTFINRNHAADSPYDSDGDGMPDAWEKRYGLDPNSPSDAGTDFDGDLISNLEEFINGTNPNQLDIDFTATAGDTNVLLTWKNIPSTGYSIYYASQTDITPENYNTLTDGSRIDIGADLNNFTINSLTNDKTYYFILTTWQGETEGWPTAEISATPVAEIVPPDPPQNVTATPGDGQVQISWSAVIDADSYNLYYATESFAGLSDLSNYSTLAGGTLLTNQTSPTLVTGLVNGTQYNFVVTAVNENGESQASDEASSVPNPSLVIATNPLNDTGITKCAGGIFTINPACPEDGYEGQDAEFGRDITHSDDADGHAGFSYTKIGDDGLLLPADATSWDCVLDNVTGLMWEVKTVDSGLRDRDWTYSWYSGDVTANGGDVGTANSGVCFDTINCDSEKYVTQVNSNGGICGYTDWRIPEINELASIINSGTSYPVIDVNYFPRTQLEHYWSSTPESSNNRWAGAVRFGDGLLWYQLKFYDFYIRLVRTEH